jgi:hypothetical protein
MILQNKLLGSVWELKAINADEGSILTNSIILDGLDSIVGYKCLIFIDVVKIIQIERMGGKLF